jgi:HrpA-like RNA helicase
LKALFFLGALDTKKELTPRGREMASFPLEPYLAAAVLASKEYGCTSEILDIISVLSSQSKLFTDIADQRQFATETRQKFYHPSGDHMTALNAVRSFQEIAAIETKGGRKDWCRKQFLNERTLIEANKIREQLKTTCIRLGIDWKSSCGENEELILKSLVRGLVQNSAFLQPDGSYRQTIGHSVSCMYRI